MKLIEILIIVGVLISVSLATQQCENYLEKLIIDVLSPNRSIASLPLPSIMYSGISTNNPGQKLECLDVKYSYFLIYIKNTTTEINTFTGVCIPPQCSLQDVQLFVQYLDCDVYQLDYDSQKNGYAITGLILLGLWLAIVIIWSIVVSCREDDVNEHLINEKKQETQNRSSGTTNQQIQIKQEWKLFNYYEGYKKIFKVPSQKNIISPIYFLAVLSYTVSTEFSYRQLISENQLKAPELLKNFGGLFVCNFQIAINLIVFILGLKLAYGVYKIESFRQMGRYLFDQVLKKWIYFVLISLIIYGFLSLIDEPLQKLWQINYGKDCGGTLWQNWFLFRNFVLDSCVCMPWLWLAAAQITLTIFATPFIVFFRINKRLGYPLMILFMMVSILMGVLVLDSSYIWFRPERVFNNEVQFIVNYGCNPLVRGYAFFMGLMFGLIILEGLDKTEFGTKKVQYSIAKKIRKNHTMQVLFHIFGIALMIFSCLLLAIFLFPKADSTSSRAGSYLFLIVQPIIFLLGLCIFLIPSFWRGQSKMTIRINKILGWHVWNHLDNISFTFYLLAPTIIAFTTFNMQSSIYYDADTLITYLLGDLLIIYILSLLTVAAIENQITMLSLWMQQIIFGKENKYSVLVIEQ